MKTQAAAADSVLHRVFVEYCNGYRKHGEHCMSRPHFFQLLEDLDFLDDAVEEYEIARVFDKQIGVQKDFTFAGSII